MKTTRMLTWGAAASMVVGLSACGGSSNTPMTPSTPTPTPTPAAAVTGVGSGALVLHPSLDSRFEFALEAPIRISETGGGSAVWEFVRMSIFRKGAEVERYELGSDVISKAGYSQIAGKSDKVYTVVLRQNSQDFDRVDITLGFGDLKDSRQFTAAVPFGTFTGVNVSLTALAVPREGTVRLGGR